MMPAIVGLVLALAAMLNQTPVAVGDMLANGEVIQTEGFIGVEWICEGQPGYNEFTPSEWNEQIDNADPVQDAEWLSAAMDIEFCYAGLYFGGTSGNDAPTLVVGP